MPQSDLPHVIGVLEEQGRQFNMRLDRMEQRNSFEHLEMARKVDDLVIKMTASQEQVSALTREIDRMNRRLEGDIHISTRLKKNIIRVAVSVLTVLYGDVATGAHGHKAIARLLKML